MIFPDGRHILKSNQFFCHLLNHFIMQLYLLCIQNMNPLTPGQRWKLKGSSYVITLSQCPICLLTRHDQTKAQRSIKKKKLKTHPSHPHTFTHVQLFCSTQDNLSPICPSCSTASAEIASYHHHQHHHQHCRPLPKKGKESYIHSDGVLATRPQLVKPAF